MEFQQNTNPIEIDGERNITLQKTHKIGMKIEDKNSFTSHFVPHEMCDNITCIPLCCSIGEQLIEESCIAKENEYLFTNLNSHVNNLLKNENKKMNGSFQWIVGKYNSNEFMFLSSSYTYNWLSHMSLHNIM